MGCQSQAGYKKADVGRYPTGAGTTKLGASISDSLHSHSHAHMHTHTHARMHKHAHTPSPHPHLRAMCIRAGWRAPTTPHLLPPPHPASPRYRHIRDTHLTRHGHQQFCVPHIGGVRQVGEGQQHLSLRNVFDCWEGEMHGRWVVGAARWAKVSSTCLEGGRVQGKDGRRAGW